MIRKKPTKAIMGTRVEDRAFRYDPHLAWIRKQACAIDWCVARKIEAAHIRLGSHAGTGQKPPDDRAIPLCPYHHAESHRVGEATFARQHGLRLEKLIKDYAAASPALRKLKAKQEKGA